MNRREFMQRSAAAVAGAGLLANPQPHRAVAASNRPNILWINVDDGRADALGCYNAPWARTPHLDRLARRGVRFANAFVQSPICVPSRRSMKTGCYVHEVGPMAMGRDSEKPQAYLNPSRMAEVAGRPNLLDAFTAAGIHPVNVGKVHAYHDHFDHRGDAPVLLNVKGQPTPYFQQQFGKDSPLLETERAFTRTHQWQIGGIMDVEPEQTETWRLGDMAVEQVRSLTANDDPFFLRVSFHAPHVACYVPPEYYIDPAGIDLPLPDAEELALKPRFERGPLDTYCAAGLTPEQIGLCRGTYFGMVSLVDVQVGRILEALQTAGRLDDTIIAFTSDQGFQLGEHGLWKKRVFYDANVRVPFILACPGLLPEGKTVTALVEMIDFLPTLLALSGISVPSGIRGHNLMSIINGDAVSVRDAVFSEIDHSQSMYNELRGGGRRVMVRTHEWKLEAFMDARIPDPDGALYHLAEDPGERGNLYTNARYADVIGEMTQLARDWDPGIDK